jgi:hypothetical protein
MGDFRGSYAHHKFTGYFFRGRLGESHSPELSMWWSGKGSKRTMSNRDAPRGFGTAEAGYQIQDEWKWNGEHPANL